MNDMSKLGAVGLSPPRIMVDVWELTPAMTQSANYSRAWLQMR